MTNIIFFLSLIVLRMDLDSLIRKTIFLFSLSIYLEPNMFKVRARITSLFYITEQKCFHTIVSSISNMLFNVTYEAVGSPRS